MKPPYDRLLDEEMQTFVRETEAFTEGVPATVEAQRAAYDAMCAHFHAGRPEGLRVRDDTIAGVPVRRYGEGDGPLVVYLHGGGFILGGLDSHDDVCAEIAARSGLPLVSVDYRLAPEHPFPAGFEDALAVVRSFGERPVVLVGDSAGATLAAGISGVLRGGSANLLGQVLIYPALAAAREGGSFATHAAAPLLAAADMEMYGSLYTGGADVTGDPRYAPLAAERFDGLPPTFVSGAECDPLHDDGIAYCGAIRAAGGAAEFVSEAGLVHGHLRARHRSARAGEAFDRIVDAVARFAQT